MKKWIIPIAYSFISTAVYLISGAIGASVGGNDTGYGGVVIILCVLILYCGIAVPVMCMLYSKKCLTNQDLEKIHFDKVYKDSFFDINVDVEISSTHLFDKE